MPPVGFEPTISACDRPQIYALVRATTGTVYSFFNTDVRWGLVVNITPRPLYPREREPLPLCEAGWALGTAWICEENLAPQGDSIPRPLRLKRVAITTTLSQPTYDKTIELYFRTFQGYGFNIHENCLNRSVPRGVQCKENGFNGLLRVKLSYRGCTSNFSFEFVRLF